MRLEQPHNNHNNHNNHNHNNHDTVTPDVEASDNLKALIQGQGGPEDCVPAYGCGLIEGMVSATARSHVWCTSRACVCVARELV